MHHADVSTQAADEPASQAMFEEPTQDLQVVLSALQQQLACGGVLYENTSSLSKLSNKSAGKKNSGSGESKKAGGKKRPGYPGHASVPKKAKKGGVVKGGVAGGDRKLGGHEGTCLTGFGNLRMAGGSCRISSA